ncbi:MAG: hypothetical protein NT133_26030 [Alphaproteobacteria bacterium]|nr:hypothetical protein [Alphaproteobacteria bacterium]
MTTGEIAFIAMVIATYAIFSVSLVAVTWKYERNRPARKLQQEAAGRTAHA